MYPLYLLLVRLVRLERQSKKLHECLSQHSTEKLGSMSILDTNYQMCTCSDTMETLDPYALNQYRVVSSSQLSFLCVKFVERWQEEQSLMSFRVSKCSWTFSVRSTTRTVVSDICTLTTTPSLRVSESLRSMKCNTRNVGECGCRNNAHLLDRLVKCSLRSWSLIGRFS